PLTLDETPPPATYTLSLHDALPILAKRPTAHDLVRSQPRRQHAAEDPQRRTHRVRRSLPLRRVRVRRSEPARDSRAVFRSRRLGDRKSTRLNSVTWPARMPSSA